MPGMSIVCNVHVGFPPTLVESTPLLVWCQASCTHIFQYAVAFHTSPEVIRPLGVSTVALAVLHVNSSVRNTHSSLLHCRQQPLKWRLHQLLTVWGTLQQSLVTNHQQCLQLCMWFNSEYSWAYSNYHRRHWPKSSNVSTSDCRILQWCCVSFGLCAGGCVR